MALLHLQFISSNYQTFSDITQLTETHGFDVHQNNVFHPIDERPDLILIDATSDISFAITQIEAVKACEEYQGIPIIALIDQITQIDHLLDHGADDCYLRPLHPRIMLGRMKQIHTQKQATDTPRLVQTNEITAILNTISESILIFNQDGICKKVILQKPQDEHSLEFAVGQRIRDVCSETTTKVLEAHFEAVLSQQHQSELQFEEMIDGKPYWFLVTLSPIDDDQILWVSEDITLRKQAEQTILDSEKRYRDVFNNANDAILIIEIESGAIAEANKQAVRQLGYSYQELIGMDIKKLERPNHVDDVAANILTSKRIIHEHQYLTKYDQLIPVETSSRIISFKGKPCVLSFSRDISQRKRALEAEREQRVIAEALRDTAAAFNSTVFVDDVYDLIITNVNRVINSDTVNIMIIDGDEAIIKRHKGYEARGFTLDQIMRIRQKISETPNLEWIYTQREHNIIEDTGKTQYWTESPISGWVKSYLGVPIIADNQVIGFINLDSDVPYTFKEIHGKSLQAFANQAGVAIKSARLFETTQNYAQELEDRIRERTAALLTSNKELRYQIQERKAIEEQLASERNLLRTLIDALPDVIYYKDLEGRFLLVNQAMLNNWNMTHDEFVGKTDYDLHPKERADSFREQEARIFNTGQLLNSYYTNPPRDANDFPVHLYVTKTPVFDNNGEIVGLIGINRDITDLRETEQQLEQVVRSARCLLWSARIRVDEEAKTLNWHYVHVTNEDAAQNFLPLDTSTQSYTEAWQASIIDEDRVRRDTILSAQIQFNNHNYTLELRCLQPDGQIRWLTEDVFIQPLDEENYQLVGVCTDITARKEAEAELKASHDKLEQRVEERTHELIEANEILVMEIEERLRAEEAERNQRILAEALRDTAATLNQSLNSDDVLMRLLDQISAVVPHDAANISLINEQGLIVTNHSQGYPDGLIKKHAPSEISRWVEIEKAYASKSTNILHDTWEEPTWEIREGWEWLRSTVVVPIRIEEGVIGFLILDSKHPGHFTEEHGDQLQAFADQAGIAIRNSRFVDRIQRHAAEMEERVKERTAELEYERAQLHAILNAIRDGVAFQDLEGKTRYINRAMTDLTGYDADDWQNLSLEDIIADADEDESEKRKKRMSNSLRAHGFWQSEGLIQRKDDRQFDAAFIATQVQDQENERIGRLSIIRDISQAKELEQQKARFIASASHELRTPIANMKTRLWLLRKQPERFEEHVEIAYSVTNWMQNLVEDMFDLSRFERGVIVLERERSQVQKLIRSVAELQIPEAERQNISIKLRLPQEPLYMTIDPYRMTQVITNLVNNAINYTDTDGRVMISLDQQTNENGEEEAIISVQDTGKGIDQETIKHLFKPFFRAHNDNKGAGLGLSISQEIVHSHGGTIEVESEVGVGSRFIIRLPMNQADQESQPQ